MLVLTRKTGEEIRVGDNIVFKILKAQDGQVRVGIEAPGKTIHREEIFQKIQANEKIESGVVNEPQVGKWMFTDMQSDAYQLLQPIPVIIIDDAVEFRCEWEKMDMSIIGESKDDAVDNFRLALIKKFSFLTMHQESRLGSHQKKQLAIIKQFVARKECE